MKPNSLKVGDEVRVIAPSNSLTVVSESNRLLARERLEKLGLKITFGKNVLETGLFGSASIAARIEDLHEAFADPHVKGILTVLGGYNSNQLLASIDYELIRNNPKIFCGYSDITALQNAFLACSGLITYSGPHYSSFAMQEGFEYIVEGFKQSVFCQNEEEYVLHPSKFWSSDSLWFLDQDKRCFEKNPGPKVIYEGEAKGIIVGGNLGTFNLLKGTSYFPSLENTILFVEDTESGGRDVEFERQLQSLIDFPDFGGVQALVIGRFEKTADIDAKRLETIIKSKPALKKLPVVYDLDFGHTTPFFTFPIGGQAQLRAGRDQSVELKVF